MNTYQRDHKRYLQHIWSAVLALILVIALCACGKKEAASSDAPQAADTKNGEVYILYTSDVHCGYDEGFGYVGLQQIRDGLEAQGYETILVDNGDAIQGGAAGVMSDGEAIIKLMNDMQYDIAVPGNHEFDYGAGRFLELTEMADFPYICCNFTHEGKRVFDPYIIKEAAGLKIAFVGITTPESLTSSNPQNFMDEDGKTIYGFMEDPTGEKVYAAVQEAVDQARAEGADLVCAMGHLGMDANCKPWTYADVISHTSGIDVFIDGHSHDTEQVTMKNKDGQLVPRTACGTKMAAVGYCHINAEGAIEDTSIWTWANDEPMPELLGVENDMTEKIQVVSDEVEEEMGKKAAASTVDLTINDPEEKDAQGHPVRMIRRAETNLGDLVTDALRVMSGSDICLLSGGSMRISIDKGDITYKTLHELLPFGNSVCVVEASGQQILDALEWGVRAMPDEFGGFMQVSGLTYEVDASIPSPCAVVDGMQGAISGPRRVGNVKVAGKPIDPKGTYTVSGVDFTILLNGDGYKAFDGAKVVNPSVGIDFEVLLDYITDNLGGTIGEDYADPYGQGRIVIKE